MNAMDELMTDFEQVDIEALRVEIEKNEVDWQNLSSINLLTKKGGELQTSDNVTAEGRVANKMRSHNLTLEDILEELKRLGSKTGGSVFRLSWVLLLTTLLSK